MKMFHRPPRFRSASALLALILGSTACSVDEGPDWSDPARIDYAPSLGVNLSAMTRTASGLYLQDLTVGSGPAVQAGDEVTVGYTGWLPDGRSFDSRPVTSPITFPLGGVIQGWQEGLLGMQPGGVRLLVIPPALAYGSTGSGPIPPNTTLIFRVSLVAIPGR